MLEKNLNKKHLASLFKIVKSWGGHVKNLSVEEYQSAQIEKAPFTGNDLGIDWESKTLFYTEAREPWWPEVIHEMGHIFACKHPPNSNSCNEIDFFGWEYVLARKIRGPIRDWYNSNEDYQIDSCDCHRCKSNGPSYKELGRLDRLCQRRMIRQYIQSGIESGNIKMNKYFKKGRIEYVPSPIR